jgi:hypothetical protein
MTGCGESLGQGGPEISKAYYNKVHRAVLSNDNVFFRIAVNHGRILFEEGEQEGKNAHPAHKHQKYKKHFGSIGKGRCDAK